MKLFGIHLRNRFSRPTTLALDGNQENWAQVDAARYSPAEGV
jgi:hypothetical protein